MRIREFVKVSQATELWKNMYIFEIPSRTLHQSFLYPSRNISDNDNLPS